MKYFLLVLGMSMFQLQAWANQSVTPPDTTTNLTDKTASLLMLEEGKKLYVEGKVREALIKFREAAVKDPNSWKPPYWISNCHYRMDNYGFCLQYAKQAVEKGSEDKDIFELLGRSYHRLNNLDSAIFYYQQAISVLSANKIKELRIKEKVAECEFAKQTYTQRFAFTRQPMVGDVNSGYNDYSPVFLAQGKEMYFTSRRNNTTGGGINPDDELYFEDIYHAIWNDEMQEWDSITNQLDKLNSDYFESITHIAADGLTGFITLNSDETGGSDLAEIEFTDKGRWNKPKVIKNKYINTSYYEGNATLTADGNTMYFVSDRNGLKKGTDIYMVQRVGKGWGKPVALSDTVNTTENETTPFITPDGRYLFFSSEGHLGMGGYDVYVSENLGNNQWTKPVNLGGAINTVNNDLFFRYYQEWKKGYVVGFTLSGQKASMDLYEFPYDSSVLPATK